MKTDLTIVGGSIIGVDHIHYGFNNQDALNLAHGKNRIVGIVTDGCGSGERTEFGSIFATQWLPGFIADYNGPIDDKAMKFFGKKICQKMFYIMDIMGIVNDYKSNFIAGHFLFTVLGFIIEDTKTYIFGSGDGVYMINDKLTIIDTDEGKDQNDPSFIPNAPDYIAYKLIGTEADFKILETVETKDLNFLIVGTDGLEDIERKQKHILKDGNIQGGVDQFLDPKFQRPNKIQKRLNVLGRINNQLKDDTTLIVVSKPIGNKDASSHKQEES